MIVCGWFDRPRLLGGSRSRRVESTGVVVESSASPYAGATSTR
jgi:hypothetical protein